MAREVRQSFLKQFEGRFGPLKKLPDSQSMFSVANDRARLYVRYSALHAGSRAFYGLRKDDLALLEGQPSVVAFLWDDQKLPLLLPYQEFSDVFAATQPASDGQYKAQVYPDGEEVELYVAQAGRFDVTRYLGFEHLENMLHEAPPDTVIALSHSQMQTMIGAIGVAKEFDIWVPQNDRGRLDWTVTPRFDCRTELPAAFASVLHVLQEIDVLWLQRGSSKLAALFEVEHSTPIYSGLLRFNDVHLTLPNPESRFSIVSNDCRRSVFTKQVARPTFRSSGLNERCSFLEYADIWAWHQRLFGKQRR